MLSVTEWIERKLGLKVNVTKTRIYKPGEVKYLGFSFWKDQKTNQWLPRPHEDSVLKFKRKLKKLTCRRISIPLEERCKKLKQLITGWVEYFAAGSMRTALKEIDSHLRTRIRVILWKQWKTAANRQKQLEKLGMSKDDARSIAYCGNHYYLVALKQKVAKIISYKVLAGFGLISCTDVYNKKHKGRILALLS